MKLNKLAHYGDFLAIPCFIITFVYFLYIENKTLLEFAIMIFILVSLIADILFSFIFLTTK